MIGWKWAEKGVIKKRSYKNVQSARRWVKLNIRVDFSGIAAIRGLEIFLNEEETN